MEQDKQGQQKARDAEYHLQDDLENLHLRPQLGDAATDLSGQYEPEHEGRRQGGDGEADHRHRQESPVRLKRGPRVVHLRYRDPLKVALPKALPIERKYLADFREKSAPLLSQLDVMVAQQEAGKSTYIAQLDSTKGPHGVRAN